MAAAGTVTSTGGRKDGDEGEGGPPQHQVVQEEQQEPKRRRTGPAPLIEPPRSKSKSVKEMIMHMQSLPQVGWMKEAQKSGSKSQTLEPMQNPENPRKQVQLDITKFTIKGVKVGSNVGSSQRGKLKTQKKEGNKRKPRTATQSLDNYMLKPSTSKSTDESLDPGPPEI